MPCVAKPSTDCQNVDASVNERGCVCMPQGMETNAGQSLGGDQPKPVAANAIRLDVLALDRAEH